MSLLKEAVEKAKLVFVRSRKHIWNNKIGGWGGGGGVVQGRTFLGGTPVLVSY